MSTAADDITYYYDNTGGPSKTRGVNPDAFIRECFLPWPAGKLVEMPFGDKDPREILRSRLSSGQAEGWVLVRPDTIKAVCEMRVCRSTAVFDQDEDGSTPPNIFYCVLEAGHTHRHTNGYHYWDAKPITEEPLEVQLLAWVDAQIEHIKSSSTRLDALRRAELAAYEAIREKLIG